MDNSHLKNNFLYPVYPFRGNPQPENSQFNVNLQVFAQKINYICNLETAGKLSSLEAYQRIESLWTALSKSYCSDRDK